MCAMWLFRVDEYSSCHVTNMQVRCAALCRRQFAHFPCYKLQTLDTSRAIEIAGTVCTYVYIEYKFVFYSVKCVCRPTARLFLCFAPGHCFVSVGSYETEGVLSGFKGAKIAELYTNC